MNLSKRKDLLIKLGEHMTGTAEDWEAAKQKAYLENPWFIPEFVNMSAGNIARYFLQPYQVEQLIEKYQLPDQTPVPKKVGIVMAGNIPLVGFHDLLCVFLSGHQAMVKPSSRDEALISHLADKLAQWDQEAKELIVLSPMIRGCDAYIATGSNNSSRYFDYYFGKYPSIIRRNRTSVALLSGTESEKDLERLAADVYQYFGLGCRNVTKIYVPEHYDFVPLLTVFKKYDYLIDHHKYKNNYDYNLAMHILNNEYYMTNGSVLLIQKESPFSRIGELHYEYYSDARELREKLNNDQRIQCIVSKEDVGFGEAQCPGICDFADGRDTMEFLKKLG